MTKTDFERPFAAWSDPEKDEFLELMNKGSVQRKLTIAQVEHFEELAEMDAKLLTNKEKFILMGYLTDKLRRTKGNLALLKVQGQLAKRAGSGVASKFKAAFRGKKVLPAASQSGYVSESGGE